MSVSFPNRNFYTSDESMHTFRRDLRARDTEAFVQFYCIPNDCVPWFTICSLMRDHAYWSEFLRYIYIYMIFDSVLWDEIFFLYKNMNRIYVLLILINYIFSINILQKEIIKNKTSIFIRKYIQKTNFSNSSLFM